MMRSLQPINILLFSTAVFLSGALQTASAEKHRRYDGHDSKSQSEKHRHHGKRDSKSPDDGHGGQDGNVFEVDCDQGQTIGEALDGAQPGDTITIEGTCRERVEIRIDRISLVGVNDAVVDGGGGDLSAFNGVIDIEGVQGVELEGLTIRNGPGEGVLAHNGAAFSARNITVEDHATPCLLVIANSMADLTDVDIRRCGQVASGLGLVVQDNSTALVRGSIRSTDNASNGISVQSRSVLEVRGAVVESTQNGRSGFDIVDSTLVIFGTPESPGSTLIARENGNSGIFVALGSLQIFGGGFAGQSVFEINASSNGTEGIALVDGGRIVSPFASVDILLEDNPTGLSLGDGTGVLLLTGTGAGLTIQNNEVGLLANGADASTLVSSPAGLATIQGNSVVDVNLRFGSRVRLIGVAVDTLACDSSVLLDGDTGFTCPTP